MSEGWAYLPEILSKLSPYFKSVISSLNVRNDGVLAIFSCSRLDENTYSQRLVHYSDVAHRRHLAQLGWRSDLRRQFRAKCGDTAR